jgi:hypothetical protein
MQQQLFAYICVVVICNDDHCGEPVCDVVEGVPLDGFSDVGDEVIKALVCAFLASD